MSDQHAVQPPPTPQNAPTVRMDDMLARRLERIEDVQLDTRERLVRLEARVDGLGQQMATKADLAALEATMPKWFIGTAIALTGIVVAAARLIR